MKEVVVELRGNKEEPGGSLIPVSAKIYSPKKTRGHEDHYCVIHCPHIFDTDKKIIGVDAKQAIQLSIKFIKELLEHHGVVLEEQEIPASEDD